MGNPGVEWDVAATAEWAQTVVKEVTSKSPKNNKAEQLSIEDEGQEKDTEGAEQNANLVSGSGSRERDASTLVMDVAGMEITGVTAGKDEGHLYQDKTKVPWAEAQEYGSGMKTRFGF